MLDFGPCDWLVLLLLLPILTTSLDLIIWIIKQRIVNGFGTLIT